jgi:hypothetical protein
LAPQARPVLHLGSELAFIERFADDGCLLGEHGYCLATVQAASGFLRTLTWPQIELGMQNAALRKGAEAAAAAAAAAVPHNAQLLHGDTGAAVAASIANASSSGSNTPKPPRTFGPRYSEIAEQIRARKANGGLTADAAMNADNTMRRIRREQRRVVGDPLADWI